MQVCDQLLPTVKQRAWHDLRKREAHATTRWWWPGRTLGIWDLCSIHGRSKMSQSGQGSEWKFKCPEFQRPEGLKSRSPEFQMFRSPEVQMSRSLEDQKFRWPQVQRPEIPKLEVVQKSGKPVQRPEVQARRPQVQKYGWPKIQMTRSLNIRDSFNGLGASEH